MLKALVALVLTLATAPDVLRAQEPGSPAVQVCSADWTLSETLRIGAIDGDQAMAPIMDLAVAPDGDLYVAQQFAPYVTVFSSEGALLRTIGRAGGGPGEFRGWPIRLGWLRDTLWVSDRRSTQFFEKDGRSARRVEFEQAFPAEGTVFRPSTPLADGTFLGRRSLIGNIAAFYSSDSVSVPRFDANGEIVGLVARVRPPPHVAMPGGGFAASHPLGWRGVSSVPVQVTADGMAVVFVGAVRPDRSATFDLVKLGIDGDTLLVRMIKYEPRALAPDERWLRNAFGGVIAGDYRSTSSGRQTQATRERRRREAEAALELPRYHPPVRSILAGEDGTVWLLRELDLPDEVDTWDIYSPELAYEGSIRISSGRSSPYPGRPRLRLFLADRTTVWGTTIDELEVPYIHRFSVDRGC